MKTGTQLAREIVVVALGGNAITREFEEGTIRQQFANTRQSLVSVVELIRLGYHVVLTHGNGPQIGNELIRNEEAVRLTPPIPLGVLVADVAGGMGYMIEQCLINKMHDAGISHRVTTVLTQVLVDEHDPELKNPSKFVGPFYSADQAPVLAATRGWTMKEDRGRGWRRVVPSPVPRGIVEKDIIRTLVAEDIVVIAGGGGGIPVYFDNRGWLEGIDGVIDKDLASAVLGNEIGAVKLLILTGVERVAVGFRTAHERFLDRLTVAEAEKYLAAGEFPAGSMGPKIRAAINFIRGGGREVVITSIEKSAQAVAGGVGTSIVP